MLNSSCSINTSTFLNIITIIIRFNFRCTKKHIQISFCLLLILLWATTSTNIFFGCCTFESDEATCSPSLHPAHLYALLPLPRFSTTAGQSGCLWGRAHKYTPIDTRTRAHPPVGTYSRKAHKVTVCVLVFLSQSGGIRKTHILTVPFREKCPSIFHWLCTKPGESN